MIKLINLLKPLARYFLIAWVITILVVSSTPNIPTIKIHTARSEIRLDYLMHFCEYGILAFMAFLSFVNSEFKMNYKKYLIITISLILFAIIDEFHQKFIPGRSFNVKDILSNIMGILGATIFCAVVFRNLSKHIENPD